MVVLVTCKNKEDQLKLKALEWSQHISHCKSLEIFFRCSRAANSVVRSWVWRELQLIQAFMAILVTCKKGEDPIKNEGARVTTSLFVDFSDVQGQITP